MGEMIEIGSEVFRRPDFGRRDAVKWESLTIIGETAQSWLAGPSWSPYKISKKDMTFLPRPGHSRQCVYTAEQTIERDYVERMVLVIQRHIDRSSDHEIIRQIADLLNLKDPETR